METGNSSLSLPTCVECSQTREHPHYLCLIQQYTQLWEWRDNTAIAFGWPTKMPKCVPPPQSAHLLRQMVFNKWQRDLPCQNIVWYSSAASSLMARYGIQREEQGENESSLLAKQCPTQQIMITLGLGSLWGEKSASGR